MTPTQREAALRLAESLRYFELDEIELIEAAALLRELVARDSDIGSTKTMLADAWALGFAAGDEWRSAVVRFWAAHDSDERNEVPRQPANPHKPAPTGPVCNLRTPWIAPDELVAEPVAWRTFDGEGGYDYRTFAGNETYRDDYIKRNGEKYASWVEPLYAAPQQRKPLTDEQIDAAHKTEKLAVIALMHNDTSAENFSRALRLLARAVEAAHGIKETP